MENELKSLLNIDVRSLYEETINHEIAERYLTILQLCRCCHRHQCRKPHTIYEWNEYPISESHEKSCECNCTHVARHICRAANLTRYDYEDSKLYKQP